MRPSKNERLRILVTGATGVYGAHFAKLCIARGHDVFSISHNDRPNDSASLLGIANKITWAKGDIRDSAFLSLILADADIGYVAHFAAKPLVRTGTVIAQPIFDINAMGTVALLDAVKQVTAKRKVHFLHISSVVGDTPVLVEIDGVRQRVTMDDLWATYARTPIIGESRSEVATPGLKCLDVVDGRTVFSETHAILRHKTKEEVFRVYYGGAHVDMTAGHSVFVFTKQGTVEPVKVADLKHGDDLVVPAFSREVTVGGYNPRILDLLTPAEVDRLGDPRTIHRLRDVRLLDEGVLEMFGAFLADGSLDEYKVSFTTNKTTKKHVYEKIRVLLDRLEFTVWEDDRGGPKKTVAMQVSSLELRTLLFAIVGHGAREKRLKKEWAWRLDRPALMRFLDGYSSDAYSKPNGGLRFTTTSSELVTDLLWLLSIHGLCPHAHEVTDEYIESRDRGKIDGREICGRGFWFVGIPVGALRGQRVLGHKTPDGMCIPTAFAKRVLGDTPIDARLRARLANKKLIGLQGLKERFPSLFESFSMGVVSVHKVEKIEAPEYVYDINCPKSGSFCAGLRPIKARNTDKVYGNAGDRPYTEDMPLNGTSIYEASKVAAEVACRAYHSHGLVPHLVISRSCNVVGTADLCWRLVGNTVRQFLCDVPAKVYTKGQYVREYMHIDDAVEAQYELLMRADEPEYAGQAFNIGSGEQYTQEQVIDLIRREHFPDGQIIRVEPPSLHFVEIAFQRLCTDRVQRMLGWQPKRNFKQAVADVVEFWKEHKNLAPWSLL